MDSWAFASPDLHQVPIDVTAGWAPVGVHTNSNIGNSEGMSHIILNVGWSVISAKSKTTVKATKPVLSQLSIKFSNPQLQVKSASQL